MGKVKIDLDDLVDAFGTGFPEIEFFLDLATGAVVPITEDVRIELARLDQESADDELDPPLAERLQQRGLPDWLREAVVEAIQIEAELGERYRRVPRSEAGDDYRAMQDFIETVGDARLRGRLWQAIEGRGAFRRFRDVLADHPREQERWYAWQADHHRRLVLAWLADEGIDVEA
jgi:hypothetical protein